jgi:hypothetical protein
MIEFKVGDYVIHADFPEEIHVVKICAHQGRSCIIQTVTENPRFSPEWITHSCELTKIEITELDRILWLLK